MHSNGDGNSNGNSCIATSIVLVIAIVTVIAIAIAIAIEKEQAIFFLFTENICAVSNVKFITTLEVLKEGNRLHHGFKARTKH